LHPINTIMQRKKQSTPPLRSGKQNTHTQYERMLKRSLDGWCLCRGAACQSLWGEKENKHHKQVVRGLNQANLTK